MQQNLLPLCLPLLLDPSITGTLQNQTINTEVSSGLAAGFQQPALTFFRMENCSSIVSFITSSTKKRRKKTLMKGEFQGFPWLCLPKYQEKKMQNFILHWHQINKVNQAFNYTGK